MESKEKPVVKPRKSAAANKLASKKNGAVGNGVKDAEATRANILNVAMEEFAEHGLSGSRIDEIAAQTGYNKSMIYYYFGNKEGLFIAALEECYRRMRAIEKGFYLDDLSPLEALRELVAFTVDYQAAHPEFVRMVMTENIHKGVHIRQLEKIRNINRPAVSLLDQLCKRGIAQGVFRKDIDAVDLHMSISALSFFSVSNKHTFSHIFSRDMTKVAVHNARRETIIDMMLRFVRPE
jgi:AcrR family transcriptional regulator